MCAVGFYHLLNVVVFAGLRLFWAHESTEYSHAFLRSVLAGEVRGAEASGATVAVGLSFLHLAEDFVVEGVKLSENQACSSMPSGARPIEEAFSGRHVHDGRQTVH